MMSDINYMVYFDGNEYLHDTLEENMECVKKINREIADGIHDEAMRNDFCFHDCENDIKKQREEFAQNISMYKIFYTPGNLEKNRIMIDSNGNDMLSNGIEITIKEPFGGKSYTIDLSRKDKLLFVPGGMICSISPFGASRIPLTLSICICPDGGILHRGWEWKLQNYYLNTSDKKEDINVTSEMINTVSGLFSGRITVDGLKIAVGGMLQNICPIDLDAEEEKIGQNIYLA